MRRFWGLLAAGVTAAAMMGDSPAATGISKAAIESLDPSRIAAEICGRRRGADLLPARLRLAAMQGSAGTTAATPSLHLSPAIRFHLTSTDPRVPDYVRHGLLLAYGFNHGAAIVSFREAQRLDPGCAICFWGEAFALGPNINAPMTPEALPETIAALERARSLAATASPAERALIDALADRYSADLKADRAALDMAYAEAMLAAAARFPQDDDIALLAAEAAMDTRPWDYWETDGRTPKGHIGDAVKLVETVLARNPDHPQASHLYIHLIENYVYPNRATAAADRLAAVASQGAGHLVHMPGHIYYRVGRFKDSIDANVAAARADEAYLRTVEGNPTYRFGYYPHNVHFLLTSAQMAGDMRLAIEQADRLGRVVSPEVALQLAWLQPVVAAPYLAYAQFASPEQMLALAEADKRLPYVVALRHYARAVARAQQQNRTEFDRELTAMRTQREGTAIQAMVDQGVPARDLLSLAESVARGRYAFAGGNFDEAADHYRRAAAIEDTIPYMEPPYWYYPVRQSLGAALLRAGKAQEARDAFMAALVRSPNNGWALYGLGEAERALNHRVEAAAADAALERAWLGDRAWLRIDRL